jgi:GTPase SAR1 family protein
MTPRRIRDPDYWNAYAFVFVVDATAPDRFPEAKEELFYLHNDGQTQAESHPLLVLANKMDLPGAADLRTISAALGVDEVSRVRKLVTVKVEIELVYDDCNSGINAIVSRVSLPRPVKGLKKSSNGFVAEVFSSPIAYYISFHSFLQTYPID